MDRLQDRIEKLYPQLKTPNGDLPGVVLADRDGRGDLYIADWNVSGITKPTDAQLLAAVLDPVPKLRRRRLFWDIYTAIGTRTAAEQTAIRNSLTSGTPPLWTQSRGDNAGELAGLHWAVTNSGATQANVNDAIRRMVALYCQDYPTYLVNPSFAPAVNIPGDEEVP